MLQVDSLTHQSHFQTRKKYKPYAARYWPSLNAASLLEDLTAEDVHTPLSLHFLKVGGRCNIRCSVFCLDVSIFLLFLLQYIKRIHNSNSFRHKAIIMHLCQKTHVRYQTYIAHLFDLYTSTGTSCACFNRPSIPTQRWRWIHAKTIIPMSLFDSEMDPCPSRR
jgi:hypothetical protein